MKLSKWGIDWISASNFTTDADMKAAKACSRKVAIWGITSASTLVNVLLPVHYVTRPSHRVATLVDTSRMYTKYPVKLSSVTWRRQFQRDLSSIRNQSPKVPFLKKADVIRLTGKKLRQKKHVDQQNRTHLRSHSAPVQSLSSLSLDRWPNLSLGKLEWTYALKL